MKLLLEDHIMKRVGVVCSVSLSAPGREGVLRTLFSSNTDWLQFLSEFPSHHTGQTHHTGQKFHSQGDGPGLLEATHGSSANVSGWSRWISLSPGCPTQCVGVCLANNCIKVRRYERRALQTPHALEGTFPDTWHDIKVTSLMSHFQVLRKWA